MSHKRADKNKRNGQSCPVDIQSILMDSHCELMYLVTATGILPAKLAEMKW